MNHAEQLILERRFSAERLAPYRATCRGDLAAALELYDWNAKISAELGATLGHLEVLLRNAMHQELTAWSAARFDEPHWYLDPGHILGPETRADIAKARSRAVRGQRPETPGRVVAELSLGFWRYLLSRQYDRSLWHPCLHRPFGRRPRHLVHDAVARLHEARNRMAHHEPMFNRPLSVLQEDALRVALWLCPVGAEWIADRCGVAGLMDCRPA